MMNEETKEITSTTDTPDNDAKQHNDSTVKQPSSSSADTAVVSSIQPSLSTNPVPPSSHRQTTSTMTSIGRPGDANNILTLLNQKIDTLENGGKMNGTAVNADAPVAASYGGGKHMDESDQCTQHELEVVRQRHKDILQSIKTIDDYDTKITHIMGILTQEYERRIVCERQVAYYRTVNVKVQKQRDRLESLCKELQRRNKLINNEINKVSVDQQKQHMELKNKFESSLHDIQSQLRKHSDERTEQLNENERLRGKIQQLLKYETVREEHYTQQLNTKMLEYKLLDAKLQQQILYNNDVSHKYGLQQQTVQQYSHNEQQLKQQLSSYADKFNQVQSTLTKSNQLFNTFKSEMDKMHSSIRVLEKDKSALAKKNNESQATIINMFEQATQDKQAIEKMKRQNDKLKSLCTTLTQQLKTSNSTAAAQPGISAAGVPVTTDNGTSDAIADIPQPSSTNTDSAVTA